MLRHFSEFVNEWFPRSTTQELPLVESFYCGTTGMAWTTSAFRTDAHPDMTVRWAPCPFCDKFGRRHTDPEYNAQLPQPHPVAYDSSGKKIVPE